LKTKIDFSSATSIFKTRIPYTFCCFLAKIEQKKEKQTRKTHKLKSGMIFFFSNSQESDVGFLKSKKRRKHSVRGIFVNKEKKNKDE
jgi:hypothetical protein